MIKKIFFLFFISCSILFSQDFTGIRIYINPGHGGHDSDDRFIPETGYWESEGNLTKGLYLKAILDSLNAITKISRTKNRTQDDLGLSVISADANNFDADIFHSIHSNAFKGTSNYTLMLYKEVNKSPAFPEAKQMCDIMVDEIYKAHRTTEKYVRGDYSFLGFNLGVLKGLEMPGTLSEGSFHDYIPESFRLKNDAYCKHEAWAITKSFIKYFELEELPYGEIAGILRDPLSLVSYYSIPSTNDSKKPLNIVKATLLPNGIVYEGDSFNNGFYFFDKVLPGTYDVVLEAEDYYADTVSVSVVAGNTTFKDKYLSAKPNFSKPEVISYSPTSSSNIQLDEKIVIEFTIRMNTQSVEQAFKIEPNIQGTFKWELNDKIVTFTPKEYLLPETDYKVTVSKSAKSFYNISMANDLLMNFKTRPSLKLIATYPTNGDTKVNKSFKIKLKFNAAIEFLSLGGKLSLEDMQGNNISYSVNSLEADYENGWIIFEPDTSSIELFTNYKIIILSGIADTEGTVLSADTSISFRTLGLQTFEGDKILNFESLDSWKQPDFSGSTTGIILNDTKFEIVSEKAISGKSGRLIYNFSNDSNGVCRLYNATETILSDNANSFGMWVYGDFSGNNLEFWFRDEAENNIPIFSAKLNWTGWKFIDVDISNTNIKKFHSIVIVQENSGTKKGWLYFDNAVENGVLIGVEDNKNNLPKKFNLSQNYPNPFNPTTIINYSIPENINMDLNNVTIKIYDVLGREVSTLLNEIKQPGNYQIEFDASNLPSGVYYYRLQASEFVQTKKMLLLK